MSRFNKLSHTIYECKYHIVFCPKYRFRIFKGEIAEYAKQQIYGLCGQKELVEVMELNVQEDHIHMVTSIPPKYFKGEVFFFLTKLLMGDPFLGVWKTSTSIYLDRTDVNQAFYTHYSCLSCQTSCTGYIYHSEYSKGASKAFVHNMHSGSKLNNDFNAICSFEPISFRADITNMHCTTSTLEGSPIAGVALLCPPHMVSLIQHPFT